MMEQLLIAIVLIDGSGSIGMVVLIATSGSYNTNNWNQFYYGDDTNAYQLNRSRDYYAIFTYGESTTQPYQQSVLQHQLWTTFL